MKRKASKPAVLAALLAAAVAGCASPPVAERGPLEYMRDNSVAQVREFAQSVKAQLTRSSPSTIIEAAEQSLLDTLKDPQGTQFRNVRLIEYAGGAVVCGEVSGKNPQGEYVGFRDFVASTTASHIRETGIDNADVDNAANAGLDQACAGKAYVPPAANS